MGQGAAMLGDVSQAAASRKPRCRCLKTRSLCGCPFRDEFIAASLKLYPLAPRLANWFILERS